MVDSSEIIEIAVKIDGGYQSTVASSNKKKNEREKKKERSNSRLDLDRRVCKTILASHFINQHLQK